MTRDQPGGLVRKLHLTLWLCVNCQAVFAQGVVSFLNNSTTLVSVNGSVIPSGQGGAYWFTLLSAPSGTLDYFSSSWSQTGLYATNQNAAGRITGGTYLVANNWGIGETKAFYVVGWSADNGTTFNPAWVLPGNVETLYGSFAGTPRGYFGVSEIGPAGEAGGGPGGFDRSLLVFGGVQGLQRGFNLFPVPEPTSFGFAVLGAAALLSLRRRDAQ